MELPHSLLSNLFLLPKYFCLNGHDIEIGLILKSNNVFNQMYELEKNIQPILTSVEEEGLVVSNDWFERGIKLKSNKLRETVFEINQYTGSPREHVDQHRLNEFWVKNGLPNARTYEELTNYKQLHPTYSLLLQHRKHSNYLKQWDCNLKERGSKLANHNIAIKGHWQSYSSYTGRITARRLPLTSMPGAMRKYIVAPEGTKLISIDLSNAELRFLAYYARCEALLEKFKRGGDVHSETAKLIQSRTKNLEMDGETARDLAKTYTYTFLYGAGTETMLKELQKVIKDISISDVISINADFTARYPEIQEFLLERENSKSLLTAYGSVEPIANFNKRQKRNFTLQSSVSVSIKLLMVILFNYDITIAHILHDEVWIEVSDDTNIDDLLLTITKDFELELTTIFDGFPLEGLLTKEIIGGKNIE